MKSLVENLELLLTCAGMLVIFGASILLGMSNPDYWPLLAVTAATVGVLHGLIFWVVRRRQREVRRKALSEAQQMLRDVINNQLTVIQMSQKTPQADDVAMQIANRRVTESIGLIAEALKNVSEESLQRWRSQYGNRVSEKP